MSTTTLILFLFNSAIWSTWHLLYPYLITGLLNLTNHAQGDYFSLYKDLVDTLFVHVILLWSPVGDPSILFPISLHEGMQFLHWFDTMAKKNLLLMIVSLIESNLTIEGKFFQVVSPISLFEPCCDKPCFVSLNWSIWNMLQCKV